MFFYQLRDIPLDLSHPITGSLASQYLTSSVIGGGSIYSVKMLRSTALGAGCNFEPIVLFCWPLQAPHLKHLVVEHSDYTRDGRKLTYIIKT